ncbi:hypothetical protein AWB92_10595 [Mycobacterium sp. IEC1808]|uniref:hypothetical protein n=1 Tax=Mycobacterium sp. IEC1808 TaxID=1743230 RepID=UPI000A15A374|nr:hypothetical protein [Mycobacterium sp. IEC1808]ORW94759.1 hypothetical protein AWB92_10595 [Mycobacterium sp. IEC1808]
MNVSSRITSGTASAVGYLLLLMAFASLGLFVAALATGSGLAAIFGSGLIVCLAGSVTAFRAASHKLARSGVLAEATSPVSIFSTPLRQDQIDRYLENYRGQREHLAPPRTAVIAIADSARQTSPERREPALLSA